MSLFRGHGAEETRAKLWLTTNRFYCERILISFYYNSVRRRAEHWPWCDANTRHCLTWHCTVMNANYCKIVLNVCNLPDCRCCCTEWVCRWVRARMKCSAGMSPTNCSPQVPGGCRKVSKPSCSSQPRSVCQPVQRNVCRQVPSTQCQQVNKRECESVTSEVCEETPRRECQEVAREQCSSVPRQQCRYQSPGQGSPPIWRCVLQDCAEASLWERPSQQLPAAARGGVWPGASAGVSAGGEAGPEGGVSAGALAAVQVITTDHIFRLRNTDNVTGNKKLNLNSILSEIILMFYLNNKAFYCQEYRQRHWLCLLASYLT